MIRRLWHSSEGNAAIELALVLPLLIIVLVGIVDYGHIHFTRLAMTNAAREGARVGVTMPESDVQATAIARAEQYLASAGIEAGVTATVPSSSNPAVTVTITIDPLEPLIGLVPTPARLTVSASMRWELANP